MKRRWRTGLGAYVRRGALAAGLDGRVSVPPGGLCASHSCRDSTTGQDAKWVWVWAFRRARISRPNATEATRCSLNTNHAYHTKDHAL